MPIQPHNVPGVYVNESPSGLRTISAAETSTPAFLGLTHRDGNDEPGFYTPSRVRSWKEFADRYAAEVHTGLVGELGKVVQHGEDAALDVLSAVTGGRTPKAPTTLERGVPLAEAVYGFFANGGGSCYIVPLRVEDDRFTSLLAALEGDEEAVTGLAGLEKVSDVAMVAAPDAAARATTAEELGACAKLLVDHCEKMMDRVAILDTLPDRTPDDVLADTRDTVADTTSYAAIYYPWVKVVGSDGATLREVPPCGHIAGVWARSDSKRGVQKTPANMGIVGAKDLTQVLTDEQQGNLNDAHINCLRSFPGQGILVWGGRTLSRDTDFTYLNVRRVVCFARDSIRRGTLWAVYEPNDDVLRASVRRNVTAFLMDLWRQGALLGRTAEQAFYVVCDDSNNDNQAVADGLLVFDIGLATVRPAEFIEFRITQTYQQPSA